MTPSPSSTGMESPRSAEATKRSENSMPLLTDGATDAVPVTVDLQCGRGLMLNKEGKCEPFAKVALFHSKVRQSCGCVHQRF